MLLHLIARYILTSQRTKQCFDPYHALHKEASTRFKTYYTFLKAILLIKGKISTPSKCFKTYYTFLKVILLLKCKNLNPFKMSRIYRDITFLWEYN